VTDSDCIIGEGTFGLVRKAMRAPSNRCVAVKTTKESTTTEAFKAILVELKIVMYVGYHPNIVEFFGAITTNIRNRKLWIQFHGSLIECASEMSV